MTHRYFGPIVLGVLMVLALPVCAQHVDDGTAAPVPIERVLNPDGTINRALLVNSSIDMRGWRIVLESDGAPRFVRDEPASDVSAPAALQGDTVAGDEAWDDRFGPPGVNGPIYAVASVNGDLFVGGNFSIAGNTLAMNIARWDGQRWSAVGVGVGGTVFSLAVDGTNLFIGGQFLSAGDASSRCVVQYDVSADRWIDMATGVYGGFIIRTNIPLARIHAIAVKGDEVYVAGTFTEVGTPGIAANGVARWNKRTGAWSAVPGLPGGAAPAYAMFFDQDTLYVGGGMGNRLYRMVGGTWSALGTGTNDTVYAMLKQGRTLIVGGAFTRAGSIDARRVASYDLDAGTWAPVGSGFDGPVYALEESGGIIYAGGRFANAGFSRAAAVARWNGSAWASVRNGISDTGVVVVYRLIARPEGLYATGRFRIAGSTSAHNIAFWNGAIWRPVITGADSLKADRNGVDGPVHALAGRGADLYAGGDFTTAGGSAAMRVAHWNGKEWLPMGAGIEGASALVRAIAIDSSGNVYVGGIFTRAGGVPAVGIARWDGSRWSALGPGIGGTTPYVFAIAIVEGMVYAGGAFSTAGGSPAPLIARYDPVRGEWSALGAGLSAEGGQYAYITSIVPMSGGITTGGSFSRAGAEPVDNIAHWDGSTWARLSARDLNAPVTAMMPIGDSLYVAGNFSMAGTDTARYVAMFDGSGWHRLADGVEGPASALTFDAVHQEIIVGGAFARASGVGAANVARWNGSSWRSMGKGTNAPVMALCESGGFLHAGGEFTVADVQKANFVARWDGGGWSALGSDATAGIIGTVLAIAVDGRDVYIGGIFAAAGGVRASGIARWDGDQWSPLGSGVDGPVRDIVISGDDVFVGGEFKHAGEFEVHGVARWIRSTGHWEPLGSGLGGDGPNAFALALVGDSLFVGGSFTSAGGVDGTMRIALWNRATETWSGIGGGITGTGYYTYVSALAVDSSRRVYAGGIFPRIGQERLNNVAVFEGGVWKPLTSGTNHGVYDIAVAPDGKVYIAGEFLKAGGKDIRRIALWDGRDWYPLGRGMNSSVHAIAVHDGFLYAGGQFTSADGWIAYGVARWNGNKWTPLGSGVTNPFAFSAVFALDVDDSAIAVGGNFTLAGRKPSYYFALWVPSRLLSSTPSFASSRQDRMLLGCSPNPISDNATVRLRLPSALPVMLELYRIDGVREAVLAAGKLEAGEHEIPLPAGSLASGTYFCRLATNGAVETAIVEVIR